MSVTPSSVEEAATSLQKVLNHPGTYTALQRETKLEVVLYTEDRDPNEGHDLPVKYRQVLMRLNAVNASVRLFFIAPRERDNLGVVIFAGNDNESISPSFGLLDRDNSVLRQISPLQISPKLRSMRYVYEIVRMKTFGGYKAPDEYMYL